MTAVPRWRERLANLFVLDIRSLALWRIALGVLILTDLAGRWSDLEAHYTDAGIYPRSAAKVSAWKASIHMFSGEHAYQAALFGVSAVFAGALVVGYYTRFVTLVSCFLLVSLHARNPLVLNGGDVFLRLQLFWAIFLPLGACWSVDGWRRRDEPAPPARARSVATAAYIFQLCFVYWFSVVHKIHPAWFVEGTAMYYAMSIDQLTRPLGQQLLAFPELMRFLTYATVALEAAGPILLFVPWRNAALRTLAILSFMSFHLGIALTMKIGLFPFIGIVAWIALIPAGLWDWLGGCCRRRKSAITPDPSPTAGQVDHPVHRYLGVPWTVNVVAAFLLLYVLVWNVRTIDVKRLGWMLPEDGDAIGTSFGLGQKWNLFAPVPRRNDGWFVTRATLGHPGGRQVDIWNGGVPFSEDDLHKKPPSVLATFKNEHWRKYMTYVARNRRPEFRKPFMEYLVRQWNRTRVESESIVKLELFFIEETTLPGGETAPLRDILLETYEAGTVTASAEMIEHPDDDDQ